MTNTFMLNVLEKGTDSARATQVGFHLIFR